LLWRAGLLVAGVGVAVAVFFILSNPEKAKPTQPAEVPAFTRLIGRWARLDGDYTIQVRAVAEDGKVDAAYFNPAPIHVGRAEATQESGRLKLVVVLQDKNYEGSTYTLVYDQKSDALRGEYLRPVSGERFEVEFHRLK
jgi:hypothetical protein